MRCRFAPAYSLSWLSRRRILILDSEFWLLDSLFDDPDIALASDRARSRFNRLPELKHPPQLHPGVGIPFFDQSICLGGGKI